eukprot:849711-Prorocentrum_minimum.AAC.2
MALASPLNVQRTVQRHLDEKYGSPTAPTVLAVRYKSAWSPYLSSFSFHRTGRPGKVYQVLVAPSAQVPLPLIGDDDGSMKGSFIHS